MTTKVLIVDDDEDAVFLLDTQLEVFDVQIRTCLTVTAAKQALAEFQPDVVLADKNIAHESGLDLFAPQRPTYVRVALLLSGERVTSEKLGQAGFDAQQLKPIDIKKLVTEMWSRLERTSSQSTLPSTQ